MPRSAPTATPRTPSGRRPRPRPRSPSFRTAATAISRNCGATSAPSTARSPRWATRILRNATTAMAIIPLKRSATRNPRSIQAIGWRLARNATRTRRPASSRLSPTRLPTISHATPIAGWRRSSCICCSAPRSRYSRRILHFGSTASFATVPQPSTGPTSGPPICCRARPSITSAGARCGGSAILPSRSPSSC